MEIVNNASSCWLAKLCQTCIKIQVWRGCWDHVSLLNKQTNGLCVCFQLQGVLFNWSSPKTFWVQDPMLTDLKFLLSASRYKGIVYLDNLEGHQLKRTPCMLLARFLIFICQPKNSAWFGFPQQGLMLMKHIINWKRWGQLNFRIK